MANISLRAAAESSEQTLHIQTAERYGNREYMANIRAAESSEQISLCRAVDTILKVEGA